MPCLPGIWSGPTPLSEQSATAVQSGIAEVGAEEGARDAAIAANSLTAGSYRRPYQPVSSFNLDLR